MNERERQKTQTDVEQNHPAKAFSRGRVAKSSGQHTHSDPALSFSQANPSDLNIPINMFCEKACGRQMYGMKAHRKMIRPRHPAKSSWEADAKKHPAMAYIRPFYIEVSRDLSQVKPVW